VALAVGLTAIVGCGEEVAIYDQPPFRRDPAPIGRLNGRFVTSNSYDDSMSIVDPSGSAPGARLPVGLSPVELEGPHHVAVDPAGRAVYVNLSLSVASSASGPHGSHGTGQMPGYVLKLDTRDGKVIGRVQVDANPGDNLLSADGKTLFVSHYDLVRWVHASHGEDPRAGDSSLIAIDTEKMIVRRRVPICPAAHGLRQSADGATLYVACGPDEIAVVDLRPSAWSVRRVPLPGLKEDINCRRCPYGLGVAPDGTVWVASLGTSAGRGGVDVFDPRAGDGGAFDPARSITVGGSAMFPEFAAVPGGFRVVLAEQGLAGDFVHIYDPTGPGQPPRSLSSWPLSPQQCLNVHMLVLSRDARRAHLVCEGDHRGPGRVAWLDLESGVVSASVAVGVFPDALAWVPEVSP